MTRLIVFIISLSIVLLFSSLWLPAHYGTAYPRNSIVSLDPTIDPDLLKSFAERKPETVLLGNSMLGEGIDEQLFDELFPGSVYKLGINGAASAVWYLVLKNVVCAVEPPPRTVLLFFRDSFLTQPGFRVDGKYRSKVEMYAGPGEVLLERLAYLDGMDWYSYYAEKWLPLFGERERLRDDIVGIAKYSVPLRVTGNDSIAVDGAIAGTFADSNMNESMLTAAQLDAEKVGGDIDHFDFGARLETSFLPAMVDVLEEHGIELVVLRVKRRRDLKANSRPAALETYVRDLRDYLDTRGVTFLDYSDEDALAADKFGEGDHLNETGREVFTRLVAEDMLTRGPGTGIGE